MDGIGKSVPQYQGLPSLGPSASLVMPKKGDPPDGFFYPTLTLVIDSYILGQENHVLERKSIVRFVLFFYLIFYVPVNNLSVRSGGVFLCWTSTKLGLTCLAQGHNAVMPVRLEPLALRSRVKDPTTEPLYSHI